LLHKYSLLALACAELSILELPPANTSPQSPTDLVSQFGNYHLKPHARDRQAQSCSQTAQTWAYTWGLSEQALPSQLWALKRHLHMQGQVTDCSCVEAGITAAHLVQTRARSVMVRNPALRFLFVLSTISAASHLWRIDGLCMGNADALMKTNFSSGG